MKALEETRTGLMIARGYTEKEVANILGKSVHTVKQQKRRLFEKTGSRNIADLTRKLISRYTGVDTDEILFRAMKDLTIIAAVVVVTVIISSTGVFQYIKTSLMELYSFMDILSLGK